MVGTAVDYLGNGFEKDDIVLYMNNGKLGSSLRVVVDVDDNKKTIICKNLDESWNVSYNRSIKPSHLLNITDIFRANPLKFLKSHPEYTEHFLKTHGEELQENHNEEP